MRELWSRDQIQAEMCRRSLAHFIRYSWHVLEPTTPLDWNWHIDAVALHVQAALEDWKRKQDQPELVQRIQNLLINIPPGTGKSRLVSVCAPAWMWIGCPSWRAIFLSANPRVALRDSVYCRELIESQWYQTWFRPGWKLSADENSKGKFKNTAGGFRQALGWFAKLTGDRADALFVDDPHDASEVHSDAIRTAVTERWDSTIANRVNDLRSSVRIGIMQRLHEQDWSGHVLAQGGWEHLCLPMEHEPARLGAAKDGIPVETAIGWRDPRTQPGELLFPTRFPAVILAKEQTRLGTPGYAGQHQQRPSPADGIIFLKHYWRRYTELPDEWDEVIQSWDMAFKDADGSDYVAGGVWGRKGADKYLLDQVHAKLDFAATCAALIALSKRWPQATRKLVEDKANGPAVIAQLKSTVPGLIAVEPDGSKLARAWAAQPEVEAKNFWLPADGIATFNVQGFIDELAAFPNGSNDDQVDQFSQAARYFSRGTKPNQVQRTANRRAHGFA